MIKSLTVDSKCIWCTLCEKTCPKNFKVDWQSSVISQNFSDEEKILEAEKNCPVWAIHAEYDWKKEIKLRNKIQLSKKIKLTENVFEYHFKFLQKDDFKFSPWQFISIFFQDEEWEFARAYSIVDWLSDNFVLCIKYEKWRWSKLLRNVSEWEIFFCSEPSWEFILKNSENKKIFIATWTWIAPIIAMLKNCSTEIEKTVIFWARFQSDIFYQDLLKSFKNTKIIQTISKPNENWNWYKWRVTDYLDEIKSEDEVYICWNPAVLNSVLNILKEKNHSENLIFHEAFSGISSKISNSQKNSENNILQNNFNLINFIQYSLYFASASILLVLFNPQYWWLLWDISWYSVVILMLIRPLSDIFPNCIIFKKAIPLRKWLWILSASIVVLAWFSKWFNPWNFNNFWNWMWNSIWDMWKIMWNMMWNMMWSVWNHAWMYFQNNYWWFKWYKFFWHLAELVWFILLITSNTFSQKKLWKNWKLIQKSSYIYFFAWWIYIAQFWKTVAIYSMLIVAIVWVLAEMKKN